jgi:MFS family permease
LAPWFVLAGIGIGCVETAEHSAVATHATPDVRGSAFGLLAAVQSLGNFAASAVAGVIWTTLSPSWAFAYLAAWMAVATTALIRNDPRRGDASTPQPKTAV